MDLGNKYRNKHNINQSQTIHITKAEIDMNITHESVHQSSGQTRSTISKRIYTSARQKNKYTSRSLYLKCIQQKLLN